MLGRQKIATLVAEFLGTGALTLLVLSVQRSTIGVPFFVALAAGLTVTVMTFSVGSISGAYFNPALTIGMWTARKIETLTAVVYIAAQLLGAWGAYYLYTYFVHSSLQPVGGHFTGRILVAEAVGAGIFAFGWAGAAYQRFTASVNASVAGLAYVVGIIAASSAAIGLLNPALALGIRAWTVFGSMGWGTYALGPVLGAVIGVNLYALLFAEPKAVAASASAAPATTIKPKKTAAKPKRKTAKK